MLELHAPQSRRLYDDWETRRHGRLFPARADFDPLELRYIIGNLSLLDVLRDPLRFRYRVHSTNMAQFLGFDLTGKEIDAAPDPQRGRRQWCPGCHDRWCSVGRAQAVRHLPGRLRRIVGG